MGVGNTPLSAYNIPQPPTVVFSPPTKAAVTFCTRSPLWKAWVSRKIPTSPDILTNRRIEPLTTPHMPSELRKSVSISEISGRTPGLLE